MRTARRQKIMISGGGFLEVLKVALPLILSNSCHAVNMFVDRLMLAQHSQEAVAAAFTGGLTNFTIACIFIGTIGYTGTFVAQYEGAHHRERIGSAVWQGVWLSLIGGIFLFSCIWIAEPLFKSFGHDPSVTAQEIDYFKILCKGGFIFLLLGGVSSFWTGRGKTGFVLGVSALITLFNLPLNYILIFGKLGLPEMGTAGAAWGTILADLIGLLIYFAVFFAPSARKHFQTHKAALDFPLLKRMIRFGLPSGVHLALDLIAFNTFSLILGCYGVAVHEAASITFGINNIAFCPIIGIGMTASILVGQAVGGENIPLAKKAARSCIILVILYSLLMMLLFTVFQGVVLAPFTRAGDTGQLESLKISSYMLYFISAYLIADGFNVVYSNALRGAGDTKFPMWVMTGVGLLGFALPCVLLYFCGFPWWSLWIVFDCEILLLGVIFMLRYRGEKWTKMRVIEVSAIHDGENL